MCLWCGKKFWNWMTQIKSHFMFDHMHQQISRNDMMLAWKVNGFFVIIHHIQRWSRIIYYCPLTKWYSNWPRVFPGFFFLSQSEIQIRNDNKDVPIKHSSHCALDTKLWTGYKSWILVNAVMFRISIVAFWPRNHSICHESMRSFDPPAFQACFYHLMTQFFSMN